jgi:predicted ArsR family transcriptional regulator
MRPTRQRILEYLDNHHTATAKELSGALQMTAANVRHHLAILIEHGVIEIIGERQAGGRGRPSQVYRRTRRAHNLDALASALLDASLDDRSDDEQSRFLTEIVSRISADDEGGRGETHLPQRLNAAVRALTNLHYQPHWEARADGPHMILGHCPYLAMIDDHPILCRLDALLIMKLIDLPVRQTAKLEKDPQGLPFCEFFIKR